MRLLFFLDRFGGMRGKERVLGGEWKMKLRGR